LEVKTMKQWQLQQAKAHFSEIIRRAEHEGPQGVTVRGKEAVIIISNRDFQKLASAPKPSFVEFMRRSPLMGLKLDLNRDKSLCRDEKKTGL
jgi:antitoxin Phd